MFPPCQPKSFSLLLLHLVPGHRNHLSGPGLVLLFLFPARVLNSLRATSQNAASEAIYQDSHSRTVWNLCPHYFLSDSKQHSRRPIFVFLAWTSVFLKSMPLFLLLPLSEIIPILHISPLLTHCPKQAAQPLRNHSYLFSKVRAVSFNPYFKSHYLYPFKTFIMFDLYFSYTRLIYHTENNLVYTKQSITVP